MGTGYEYRCDHCGYTLRTLPGTGMFYPVEYRDLVAQAKKGTYGNVVQIFLAEHPDGALDCSSALYRCSKCGEYETRPKMTMYLPKEKTDEEVILSIRFMRDGIDYVDPYELKEKYKCAKRYIHKCADCGGRMKMIPESDLARGIICPECKWKIYPSNMIMWD